MLYHWPSACTCTEQMMAMFAFDAASPCIWKQLAEDIVTLFDGGVVLVMNKKSK